MRKFIYFFVRKFYSAKKHPKPQSLGCYIFNYKPQLLPALNYFARNRKVTACARVQVSLGTKVVSVTPVVIFFSTAHRMAL